MQGMPRNRTPENTKENMIEYSNSQIEAIIDDYIHSDRDRSLLKSRLIDGLTHEKLAEKYDLSVRQVKRLIYKKQEVVFKHLEDAKTHPS